MPFASDKQRKAFFAMRGVNSKAAISPQIIRNNKNATMAELNKKGIFLVPNKDADKDGVVNIKDCRPFDPKRQGKLHDLAISALRKKEEFVERRREKKMRKLEDLKDKLRARKELLSKRNDILAEKQSIIDEFNRERKNLKLVAKANKEAKRELFRTSKIGRLVRATGKGVKITGKGLVATGKAIPKGARIVTKGAKTTVKFGRATNRNINKAIDVSEGALRKTERILNRLI